jgi:hypothetical protein
MKPSPTGTDRLGKDNGMKKGGKVKKIPSAKLAAAAKKPGKVGKRARLAETLKEMKK